MITIHTYQDNGPYFPASKGRYQAARLSDFIRHVRQSMEDREDVIAIFDKEGSCKGLWHREVEGHVDSAGDAIVDHEGYERLMPSTKQQWTWNRLVEQAR
jgi:hypothetical protein